MIRDSNKGEEHMTQRGMSRRQFLKVASFLATALALPAEMATDFARVLAAAPRVPVIWLEFQDCTGDTESFLRAARRSDPNISGKTDPSITELLLDVISLDYHETIMAPAGAAAEKSRNDTMLNNMGKYVCIVEGSIPTAINGAYCVIGGRSGLSIAQEVCANSLLTIAVGSCAWDGGLAGAAPNPTGAVGVKDAVPGIVSKLVNLPGCPANVVNIVATIVYYLTYNQLPALDSYRRPLFAYGHEIHDECPREDHYEEGRFALAWGDEGHKKGWCLYKMGCRGPWTKSNCAQVKWNDGTSWPIGAGHGCIGCTSPHFWDQNTPFYTVRPGVPD